MPSRVLAGLAVLVLAQPVLADGPKDNLVDDVRQIPPKGIDVPAADLAELRKGLATLRKEIDALPKALRGRPQLLELIPDVEVFHKAVRYAVEYGEFFKPAEIQAAKDQLAEGMNRAIDLRQRRPDVDDRDRAGRPRLPVEDRRVGAALRASGAGNV